MDHSKEIVALLTELRDQQRTAIELQRKHLESYENYVAQSNQRVEHSIKLQEMAVQKQKQVTKFVLPVIILGLLSIAAIVLKGLLF